MKTVLLSNIPHYHHLALALHNAGLLSRYITSIALYEGEKPPPYLSDFLKKKLEGRRIVGVPREKTVRIRLPEFLQRGLPKVAPVSSDRADWLNNFMFDYMAKKWVENCDVFHFVYSVGLNCARKAKDMGAFVINDWRQGHPHFQNKILREEAEFYGLECKLPGCLFEDRMLAEIEISDHLIVPSQYAKNTFMLEGIPEERISVVPYGADLTHFSREERNDDVFRVLFVGQISLLKGIPYLLKAFHDLRLPGAELLLIGTVDPDVKPLLRKYEGEFRHIPAVPKIELSRHYNKASLLVLPSLADAYPLVVREAMACGLPVIVSKNTGSKEGIEEGVEGFVVPIRDSESIREKIRYLYEHPDERRAMGEAAHRRALEMTWERYGERAIEVYGKIAERCARGAA